MSIPTTGRRKHSWMSKYAPRANGRVKNVASPPEGREQIIPSRPISIPRPISTSTSQSSSTLDSPSINHQSSNPSRTDSESPSFLQLLDQDASERAAIALERTASAQQPIPILKVPESLPKSSSGSFSKMALNSMLGGLSVLSLSRTNTRESSNGDEKVTRGRSMLQGDRTRSSSDAVLDTDTSRSVSRARSQSPFSFRRFRQREFSPTPQPLPLASIEADLPGLSAVRPRTAFDDPDSGDEAVGEGEETEDEWSDDALLDPVTERNTERNALVTSPSSTEGMASLDLDVDLEPDPLGEGVNVIVPPEPYFPSTLDYASSSQKGKKNPRRRKSTRQEPLPLLKSRPIFLRDRCAIEITQGDPEAKLNGRKHKRYVVASDLSEESRYAVEWGIGTVLRDGDELMIVTIIENESKGELYVVLVLRLTL
jgi:hypothetical protein